MNIFNYSLFFFTLFCFVLCIDKHASNLHWSTVVVCLIGRTLQNESRLFYFRSLSRNGSNVHYYRRQFHLVMSITGNAFMYIYIYIYY